MQPTPRSFRTIEPLESRIAPAVVVNALNHTIATFVDVDGDLVTIKVSAGDLTNAVFTSAATGNAGGEQLQKIDLSAAGFEGVSLTLTAKRGPTGGDGHVNVGQILAMQRNLGAVLIPGDLGQIDAGNNSTTIPALKSLTVNSLGEFGAATMSGDLRSSFSGALGKLTVKSHIRGAIVEATGNNGKIGAVFVGGSLIGGASQGSGAITANGNVGSVFIGGDIRGGAGAASGQLFTTGTIASVTVNGSVLGSGANFSGLIQADSGLGPVKIGGRVEAIGAGTDSATIKSGGPIASVTIARDLIGAGVDSGRIASIGPIGPVKIGGDLRGGTGAQSGSIDATGATGKLGPVTIGGDFQGGAGADSGLIRSGGDMGKVTILHDMVGNGMGSADILPGKNLGGVFIGGSLVGAAQDSGRIRGSFALGDITVRGDVVGGAGLSSGSISTQNIDPIESIGVVRIGGDLIGGAGIGSGTLASGEGFKSITIGGSILGGAGGNSAKVSGSTSSFVRVGVDLDARDNPNTAAIDFSGKVGSVFIGGSAIGGTDNFSARIELDEVGGFLLGGDFSGAVELGSAKSFIIAGSVLGGVITQAAKIEIDGNVDLLRIGGDLRGGSAVETGFIELRQDVVIKALTIGGSIYGGTANQTGAIIGLNDVKIGVFTLGGDLRGGDGNAVANRAETGYIDANRGFDVITIGGSIIAGTNPGVMDLETSGSIRTQGTIGSLLVKGSIVGNTTNRAILTAGADQNNVVAFGRITVLGRVERADILGGYDESLTDGGADAQIGTVTVTGDWIASSLVAGVDDNDNDGIYGEATDVASSGGNANIFSKIASIVIGGAAYGTPSGVSNTDSYAFGAQEITSLKIGGVTFPLTAGRSNDISLANTKLIVGPTQDLFVHEV